MTIVPHVSLVDEDESSDEDEDEEHADEQNNRQTNLGKQNQNKGLHIYLSKQFYLQGHSIHAFVSDLKRRIGIIRPFSISLTHQSTYSN